MTNSSTIHVIIGFILCFYNYICTNKPAFLDTFLKWTLLFEGQSPVARPAFFLFCFFYAQLN